MKKRLELIQASRAIVPLLVAIVHLAGTMQVKYNHNFLGISDLPKSGGVDYFFVLTGFMMFYVYGGKIGNKEYYKTFLYNRFIRLYPFYWVLAIPVIPLLLFVPGLGSDNLDLFTIIKSLLLWPQEHGPYIFVAWSLSYNVFFYIVFALILGYSKKIFLYVIGIWSISIGIFSLLPESIFIFEFIFSPYFINFIIGSIIASLIVKFKYHNFYIILLILGLSIFVFNWLNIIFIDIDINADFLYLIFASLVITGLSGIDLGVSVRVNKFFNYLGDASFAIFLSHTLTISVLTKTMDILGLTNKLNLTFLGLIIFVGTIIIGCLLYQLIEKPLHSKLKRRSNIKSDGKKAMESSLR